MSLNQFKPAAVRFVKFGLVGGSLFAINYLAFYFFVLCVPQATNSELVYANFAIAGVSLLISYWVHTSFTFADQNPKPSVNSFLAYLSSVGLVIVLRNVMFASLLEFGVTKNVAFTTSLIVPHILAFLFYQGVVFNRGE